MGKLVIIAIALVNRKQLLDQNVEMGPRTEANNVMTVMITVKFQWLVMEKQKIIVGQTVLMEQ